MPSKHKLPAKRIFCDGLPGFSQEVLLPQEVLLTDAEVVHYLAAVVRIKPGDALELIDPVGGQGYEALVQSVSKRQIGVTLNESMSPPSAVACPVTLAVGIIKEQRWDWLLQKATELGVDCIVPLLSERVIVQAGDWEKKRRRWQAVLQSAAEQSEQWRIPDIALPVSLTAFLSSLGETERRPSQARMVLLERSINGLERLSLKSWCRQHLDNPSEGSSVLALCGPEGGWSPQETHQIMAAGFSGVSLGDKILRSETAAIMVVGIVGYECREE